MPARPKPAPEALPEFTSDRLRLLGPLITPRVVELARERVLSEENFFTKRELRVEADLRTVKIALLVAQEMNPFEDFGAEEEALMRGISVATLAARKKAKEIRLM